MKGFNEIKLFLAKIKKMSQENWVTVKEYTDITYKKCNGVARIAFNRPDVRNAFVRKQHQNCTMPYIMLTKM